MTQDEYKRYVQNWRIRNTRIPLKNITSVYRYMDSEYIDEFFETGDLKLSTYSGNRMIEDANRKDAEEGREFVRIHNKRRNHFVDFENEPFGGWFTFCTSAEYNPEKFFSKFNTNGCFEITNTTAFGIEIAKVLEKFSNGFESLVNYSNERSFQYFLENYPEIKDFDKNTPNPEIVINVANLKINDFELLFRKRTSFSTEQEYRHVWRVIDQNQSEFIKCPEALKYCRKLV